MERPNGSGHCVAPYRVEDNFGGDANRSRIWVYDNEQECVRQSSPSSACVTNSFIDVDLSANTFTFQTNTGDGMFAIPQEIYNGRRTAPIVLLGDGLALPQLLLFVAGGADARYSSPQGEWGWRSDGRFIDNFPGLRAVVPLGSSGNSTRSVPVLITHSNTLSHSNITIQMNVRGSHSNLFHASANGISLQLESMQGTPGANNQISLGTHSNELASFSFRPQLAQSNFVSRIGLAFHSNSCATFQWMGRSAEPAGAQEFRALKERRAVEYGNRTGKPTRPYPR